MIFVYAVWCDLHLHGCQYFGVRLHGDVALCAGMVCCSSVWMMVHVYALRYTYAHCCLAALYGIPMSTAVHVHVMYIYAVCTTPYMAAMGVYVVLNNLYNPSMHI